MNRNTLRTFAVLTLLPLVAGCVERKMMIRSQPAGAWVWVDEEPVGKTPVALPFKHYGRRTVRVGPITDEEGNVQYVATERMMETAPPWYQLFPVDFFSEVLWPGTLVDEQEIEIHLPPAEERHTLRGLEAAREVRDEAEKYRRESLSPVPQQ